jgi:spore maturation protein CgeB
MPEFQCDLSYLGTYAEDRQDGLERLLVEPARREPHYRFLIGGSMYPQEFPWTENIFFVRHIPPFLHAAFYSSSRLTLNVTRRAMAEMGWCPAGRLFEAAACGVPVVSDNWEGLDYFYTPGSEILVCNTADDVISALGESHATLGGIAARARERTLDCHTSARRADELIRLLEGAGACGESSLRREKEAAYNH